MRQDFFSFIPQFTLMIFGNYKPQLRSIDDAIRRRMHLVPFTHKPELVDTGLTDKLKGEWPGILQWMIEGCLEYQWRGLDPPSVVLDATKDYFQQEDKLGNWIEECCIKKKEEFTTTNELFTNWINWCETNNEYKGSNNSFAKKLVERGFRRGQSPESKSRSRGFYGLTLSNDNKNAGEDAVNDFQRV